MCFVVLFVHTVKVFRLRSMGGHNVQGCQSHPLQNVAILPVVSKDLSISPLRLGFYFS